MYELSISIPGLPEHVERLVKEALRKAGGKGPDAWLDVTAASQYSGLAPATIRNLISKERLPRYGEKGHKIMLRRSDLDAYIANRGRRR